VAEVELPEALRGAEGEGSPKGFTRRVALTTAVYAVVLAITSLGANHVMKETLLAQQQASDQWAFYQAKVIREHQYRGQALQVEAALVERGPVLRPEARAKYEELQKKFAEESKRYAEEKKDVEAEARKLEHERDVGKARNPNFDVAEALVQIAIVVASVSILAQSRALYGTSLVFAGLGLALCLNGFLLVVHLF
jgi:Domain of unknown function (DUF4337)